MTHTITISDIRTWADDLDMDINDRREIYDFMMANETDFEVGNWRFIETEELDAVLAEELGNGEYTAFQTN